MQQNQHLSTDVHNYFSSTTLVYGRLDSFLSDTIYFYTFTCYQWFPLIDLVNGYNKMCKKACLDDQQEGFDHFKQQTS